MVSLLPSNVNMFIHLLICFKNCIDLVVQNSDKINHKELRN